MAFRRVNDVMPCIAASAINYGQAVALDVGDVQRQVLPLGTNTLEAFGLALATAVNPGDPVSVHGFLSGNVEKVVAGASLGHGADIGIGSTNGALAPIVGASGVAKWRVGKSMTAAAVGETFSLYVAPRQLSGLV